MNYNDYDFDKPTEEEKDNPFIAGICLAIFFIVVLFLLFGLEP